MSNSFLISKTGQYRLVGASSGVDLIADERTRQISEEGFTPEHDDQHTKGELSTAAAYYACQASSICGSEEMTPGKPRLHPGRLIPHNWPWTPERWKPSDDPIRNLVKAGALIAAEIDRLRRMDRL